MAILSRTPDRRRRVAAALRWTARALSLASFGLLLLIFVGDALAPSGVETTLPSPFDWIALAFFPLGLLAGMAIGWWRPLPGGAIGLVSLALFYLIIALDRGRLPAGPWFAIVASPALLFTLLGWLERRRGSRDRQRAGRARRSR